MKFHGYLYSKWLNAHGIWINQGLSKAVVMISGRQKYVKNFSFFTHVHGRAIPKC